MVISVLIDTSVVPSGGSKIAVGTPAAAQVKVVLHTSIGHTSIGHTSIGLSCESSIVASIFTSTLCSLEKLLVGLMVITVLLELIVASNEMLKALSPPVLFINEMSASTFESVSALSSILRTAYSKSECDIRTDSNTC